MAKLQHITFTGIDGKTDIRTLRDLQLFYPIAEYGVLISNNWRENGNRFFNPSYLSALDMAKLNLSAHFCGRIAREAICGNFGPAFLCMTEFAYMFNRCQMNISSAADNPDSFALGAFFSPFFREFIIQQKSADNCSLFLNSTRSEKVSVLLDGSGGMGIDTPINVLPNAGKNFKVGYAGGFNPDNVAEKLTYLYEQKEVGDFWIDMESGVRTNDWFDLDKVHRVLEICQPIINKYEEE